MEQKSSCSRAATNNRQKNGAVRSVDTGDCPHHEPTRLARRHHRHTTPATAQTDPDVPAGLVLSSAFCKLEFLTVLGKFKLGQFLQFP